MFSSTYNIASASAFYLSRPQKKSAKPSAFYTFENPQIRKSAFYRRPVSDVAALALYHCLITARAAYNGGCDNLYIDVHCLISHLWRPDVI